MDGLRQVRAEFTSRIGSELFFGRPVTTKKDPKLTHDDYEEKVWPEKVHRDEKGRVYWPPFALKNALEEAGKFLSIKIPGEGKKTYTDRFRKGVLIVDRMFLCLHDGTQVTLDDIVPRPLFVPSDGKRGSGKRVTRIFPALPQWKGTAIINVTDPKISDDILLQHLQCVGQFIGFGSMRVGNGGINGMFAVEIT